MAEITKQRQGEIVRAIFKALLATPRGLKPDEVFALVEKDLGLTEFEQSEYSNHPGVRRFERIARFSTISSVKAGWLLKSDAENTQWRVTPEGQAAFEQFSSPEDLMDEANRLYKVWKQSTTTAAEKDKNTADYGRWLFGRLCKADSEKRSLLQLLADSMIESHACGSRCWCVTSTPNRVRLNVNFMAVMTVTKTDVHLSTSADLLSAEQQEFLNKNGRKEEGFLKSYPTVRWYVIPRTVFIGHRELLWPAVKKMIEFVGTPRDGKTPWLKAHVPGIGRYIAEELARELPTPTASSEVDTVARTEPRVAFTRVEYDIEALLNQLKMGDIGLPEIQRPFVWTTTQVRDLFDSMYRGYPVGYLLFWSNAQLRDAKRIGVEKKPYPVPARLVVDGQQRLTSLFAVMRGAKVLDSSFNAKRIEIAFRPRDGRFDVPSAATQADPEFINDISQLWTSDYGQYGFVKKFLATLQEQKKLSTKDEGIISSNIDRVFDLTKFPFTALEISPDVEEEQVAEIFVRINSRGVKLNQADFLLTLLSVFWPDGREALEQFSRDSMTPARTKESPRAFNPLIAPAPDQLLRVVVAAGFYRARLKSVYQVLRGKDITTGKFSHELRDKQFAILRASQEQVLDLKHWHLFLNAIQSAGFRGKNLISSEIGLLYTYVFYLIGKTQCHVPDRVLERLIGRWFYFLSVTARYSGSAESIMDEDLNRVKNLDTSESFVDVLEQVMATTLTDEFWRTTLPFTLVTSSSRNPAMLAFYAAQCQLGAPVLFSDKRVADLFDLMISPVKKAVEKHHLFPRQWLSDKGIDDRKMRDQVANFSYVEWSENIKISDEAPSEYVPRLRNSFDASSWEKMMELHALPQDWERMDYPDFLEARRPLIAKVIQRSFEALSAAGNTETGTLYIADGTKGEQEVWSLIRTLETRLRTLIMNGYSNRWGQKAEVKMREFLGEEQSSGIDKNRDKGAKTHQLADKSGSVNDFLDYSYLGQLMRLMQAKDAWAIYGKPFRDQRELEDLMKAIISVRNDTAHFRSVPEKELIRCKLAVSDLEKRLDALA
jgi:hypothetical protein